MTPVIFALFGNELLADALSARLTGERGHVTLRSFPDGETYVRVDTPVRGRAAILACTLHHPDDKLIPLLFLAATARELGATNIGLVAPYLAYMRQDRRFAEGEGITSAYFAAILSGAVDWVVTVDPHLHRRQSLSEIYRIPTHIEHAAPHVAKWIRANVPQPLLIGPDAESAQWVSDIAERAGAPFVVLNKTRRGDRHVEVSLPNVDGLREHTPVLIDDIVSTARTMIAAIAHLRHANMRPPVCVGVHAVFAHRAYDELRAAGAAAVVTCNTIPHPSNAVDLHGAIADGVRRLTSPTASRARRAATPR